MVRHLLLSFYNMTTPLEARLTEENAALRTQLEALTLENKLLREKVDLLVRRIFGAKSEPSGAR